MFVPRCLSCSENVFIIFFKIIASLVRYAAVPPAYVQALDHKVRAVASLRAALR